VRVRRWRCHRCGRTGGVLPEGVLHRRLDGIDTVGRIIAAGIRGTPVRQIAQATGVPARTVRDVRRRYRDHAPDLARRLLALSVALGGQPSLVVDIPVEPERRAAFGLGAAWTAARRQGAPGATPWRWLATISGGRVLGTNTRLPGTGRWGLPALRGGPTLGHDAGPLDDLGGARRPSGRAPPSTSWRVLSSGAARHHRPPPNHLHAILPDRHQIARPATPVPSDLVLRGWRTGRPGGAQSVAPCTRRTCSPRDRVQTGPASPTAGTGAGSVRSAGCGCRPGPIRCSRGTPGAPSTGSARSRHALPRSRRGCDTGISERATAGDDAGRRAAIGPPPWPAGVDVRARLVYGRRDRAARRCSADAHGRPEGGLGRGRE
jgi:hypothetical protein